jgi:predicted RNA binding protein YcfA (HicA-like mRNA interferase family)
MKIPRDVDGEQLAKLLERYRFQITRQTGSHIRLITTIKGVSHYYPKA